MVSPQNIEMSDKKTDWLGQELELGDIVIFITGNRTPSFKVGKVTKLNKTNATLSIKGGYYTKTRRDYRKLIKANDKIKLLYKLEDTSGSFSKFKED